MALYSTMALTVQIISEETIKPSSSLKPDHLKTHKLSCMDQASPPRYMPILLTYPNSKLPSSYQNGAILVETLKSSLSKTLSHYYPFAGRYSDIDRLSIDCNDKGVPFVLAHVAEDNPKGGGGFDDDELLQLIPCHPEEPWLDGNGEQFLLAVRVSFFKSTGITIGISAWHGVADGSTLGFFLQSWAAICRADPNVHGLLNGTAVLDYVGSMSFPPANLSLGYGTLSSNYFDTTSSVSSRHGLVEKRFLVSASYINALREQITRNTGTRPSRVLAVSSLVWAAAIRVSKEKRNDDVALHDEEYSAAAMIVNLRSKTRPPLPPFCMGNLYQRSAVVKWPISRNGSDSDERVVMLGDLAGRLGEAVQGVNDEFLRKLYENNGEGYMEFMKSWWEEYEKEGFIVITSLCGYGNHGGADFGFGAPGSFHGFSRSNKTVLLLDAKDGQGVEVLVTLDENDMAVFEKDPAWSSSSSPSSAE